MTKREGGVLLGNDHEAVIRAELVLANRLDAVADPQVEVRVLVQLEGLHRRQVLEGGDAEELGK